MVNNPSVSTGDMGSIPGRGAKMPHAMGRVQTKQNRLLGNEHCENVKKTSHVCVCSEIIMHVKEL